LEDSATTGSSSIGNSFGICFGLGGCGVALGADSRSDPKEPLGLMLRATDECLRSVPFPFNLSRELMYIRPLVPPTLRLLSDEVRLFVECRGIPASMLMFPILAIDLVDFVDWREVVLSQPASM
jgi:hypothetical protein